MRSYAIIVLNYCYYESTLKCVNKLLDLHLEGDIVIVDNCSNNNSYEILNHRFSTLPNVHVIKSEKNGGYSYGNNYGIKYILSIHKVDYICIMNPDVEITYDIFKKLISRIDSCDDIALITALEIVNGQLSSRGLLFDLNDGKRTFSLLPTYFQKYLAIFQRAGKITFYDNKFDLLSITRFPGSFFVIKTNCFEEAKLFDENMFLYFEEMMLSYKLFSRNLGMVCSITDYFLHDRNVTHDRLRSSFKNYYNQYKAFVESFIYFIRFKNVGKVKIFLNQILSRLFLYIEIPIKYFLLAQLKKRRHS